MHTKGPWFAITVDGTDFTAIATQPELSKDMDLDCEILGTSEWLRVTEDDLRLMAAAPELLDAASKALKYMRAHKYADKALADDLESAIRKATSAEVASEEF